MYSGLFLTIIEWNIDNKISTEPKLIHTFGESITSPWCAESIELKWSDDVPFIIKLFTHGIFNEDFY